LAFQQDHFMAERPLSPHLGIYRFGYTMSLSILHRITGVALSVALIAGIAWLVAAASGAEAYGRTLAILGSWPFKAAFGLALVALVYHFCNGLRHLAWDAGWGFERAAAKRSALIVIVASVLIAALCIYLAFCPVVGS
jgi:succinate dehydrogenase / fumarate reductase cytochrome b subunit